MKAIKTGRIIQKNINLIYVGFIFLLLILFIGMSFIPVSIDYDHYLSTTRAWLTNNTMLYDIHSNSFYYLPWSLFITTPLSVLPDRWGQAIFNTLSLICIVLSLFLTVKKIPWWGYFLVIANLFTLNLIFSTQWDGLILGAIGLAWWSLENDKPFGVGAALTIISTKPTNVYFVILLIVLYIFIKWDIRSIIKTVIIPLVIGIGSFFIAGFDWPIRYLKYLSTNPPPSGYNLSIWNNFNTFSVMFTIAGMVAVIIMWIILINKRDYPVEKEAFLIFALLINLLISNYVLSYHFVYTMPALGWLSKKHRFFSLCIYGLMLCYVFKIINPIQWLPYIVYPLSILIFCLLADRGEFKRNSYEITN